jgi:hypothetical protein
MKLAVIVVALILAPGVVLAQDAPPAGDTPGDPEAQADFQRRGPPEPERALTKDLFNF